VIQSGIFAYNLLKKPTSKIILLKDNLEIDELYYSLEFFKDFLGIDCSIERFYSYEIPPVSSIPPSSCIVADRIKAIRSLIDDKLSIFLTNINAVLQPVISEEEFFDKFETINVGGSFDVMKFAERLVELRYERKDFVEDVGDFAKRGSIFDVFSPFYDKPLRIEFFDDEIESIKLFYLANNKTYKTLNSCEILPAKEYDYEEDNYGYANLKNGKHYSFLVDYDNVKKLSVYRDFKDDFVDSIFEGLDFYKKTYSLELFLSRDRFDKFLSRSKIYDDELLLSCDVLFADNASIDEKIAKMEEISKSNKVVIACASKIRLERVGRYLGEKGVKFLYDCSKVKKGICLSDKFLKKGFFDKDNHIAFVSFEDLFGKSVQRNRKIGRAKQKTFIQNSKVVHKKYGIGIYKGIKKMDIDGELNDFIEIEYTNNDRLYVPVYGVDNVFEYHGDGELSSLNSSKWKTTQDNIKKSIKKILTELVNTYAKRQLAKREPFVVDSLEYKEFEATFEYEETRDQAQAIEDIKKDMQSNRPMDRLVCGDVSFGKTEVAMRACAISVFNAKQAVFMAPTTVLSIQHYNTLVERFKEFPVNIALLNRFSTNKEREDIIKGLKNSTIDILVSTHSVYSDKIEFANLGLVVIDEEQRFGVKVKEHLKERYPSVDMLYLSATPIPRTLNMALNGIFDISVIKTPPLERKPIETFVLKRKHSVIRDAILKELSRNGSVYFVHNNIETIENIKNELDSLLPFAKKAIVHAKMKKKQIKETLDNFNKGMFDILIATSIIESGLDIKNVNTIIIDNAERFGLADLYQLRGRVGRGDRVAYAYLLRGNNITDDAKKRLYFMKEFVERGVGFNLALKDMEIRGGGNILGKDQAGKIKSIGFETYSSLIEEAISEIKNEPVERDVEIKCSFSAYIDDEFANQDDKFAIYKMIYSARTNEELEMVESDIESAFGTLPKEAKNLLFIAYLKIAAKKAFVKSLSISQKGVMMEFYVDAKIDTDKLIKVIEENGGRFVSEFSVFFDKLGNDFKDIYNKLKNILHRIV